MVTHLLHVMLLGLFGAGHCASMCGVFALGAAAGERRLGRLLVRQVAYQAGKATAYLFLGALLLAAGRWWDQDNPILRAQVILGSLVGIGLVVMGVSYVTEWRGPAWWVRWWQGSPACRYLVAYGQAPSWGRSVLTGWFNGFLPCGLSLMALLYLVGTNSAETLVVGVYVFGFATLPALATVAVMGTRGSPAQRRRWMRWGGIGLIVLGGLTLVRGSDAVHGWMHRHLIWMPGAPSSKTHDHPLE